jgi:hypothetical protein
MPLFIPAGSPRKVFAFLIKLRLTLLSSRYNSVAKIVLTTVKEQLSKYPKYSLVTDGHGMGGSLAILAAVSLKSNFPGSFVPLLGSLELCLIP